MMVDQLSFEIPLLPTGRRFPSEPIVRAADIDGPYRFTARRTWGPGRTVLLCGLNPSKADGKQDDPTMLRMIGFAYRWGFGSLVVCNLFPFITSHPKKMRDWLWVVKQEIDDDPAQVWPYSKSPLAAFLHNHDIITRLIAEDTTCVAAWGNGAQPDEVDQFIAAVGLLGDTEEYGAIKIPVTWHCIGRTKDGNPTHPLARGRHRVPDDAQLEVWRKP